MSKFLEGLSSSKKRTVRMPDVLGEIDSQKILYPKGVLSTLHEFGDDSPRVKRIELFAEDENETYGIIRNMFVAYSIEKRLLQIGEASSNVIHVRSLNPERNLVCEKDQVVGDKLVLKRAEIDLKDQEVRPSFRAGTPRLLVSSRWLERMNLKMDDRIIISNPIENYAVPPPNLR